MKPTFLDKKAAICHDQQNSGQRHFTRGVGWRSTHVSVDGTDNVCEFFGLSGAWMTTVWWHGYLVARPAGVFADPHAALSAALRAASKIGVSDAEVPALPPIVVELLERAVGADVIEQHAALDLCAAFRIEPPSFARLARHGQSLSLAPEATTTSGAACRVALRRYVAEAPVSAHERAAVWRVARLSLPTEGPHASSTSTMTPTHEAIHRQPFGCAASMLLTMLTGPGVPAGLAWLTLDEAAALMRLSVDEVQRLIASGLLPAIELPGYCRPNLLRVTPAAIEECGRRLLRNTSCRSASDQRLSEMRRSSVATDPHTSTSNIMTPDRNECVSSHQEPRTLPQLKLPGRGYASSNPERPTRKMPHRTKV